MLVSTLFWQRISDMKWSDPARVLGLFGAYHHAFTKKALNIKDNSHLFFATAKHKRSKLGVNSNFPLPVSAPAPPWLN